MWHLPEHLLSSITVWHTRRYPLQPVITAHGWITNPPKREGVVLHPDITSAQIPFRETSPCLLFWMGMMIGSHLRDIKDAVYDRVHQHKTPWYICLLPLMKRLGAQSHGTNASGCAYLCSSENKASEGRRGSLRSEQKASFVCAWTCRQTTFISIH